MRFYIRSVIGVTILLTVGLVGVTLLAFVLMPAGQSLLYISQPRLDQRASLYVHDIDRDIRYTVRDDLIGWGLVADWSPQGDEIVYSSFGFEDAHRSLYITDLYGVRGERISPPGMDSNSPAWSPDGRYIAFMGASSRTIWDVFIYDLQTGEIQTVFDSPGTDSNPTWSPDGRYLAFDTTINGGQNDIYLYDTQTAAIRQITDDFSNEVNAGWWPDGSQLLMVSARRSDNVNLWQVDLATGSTLPVTDLPGVEFEPSISPNGDIIAFMSEDNAARTRHIYLIKADGDGPVRQITTGDDGFRRPSFRP